jgi:hypothetical protein
MRTSTILFIALLLSLPALAQTGPDVIVGAITGPGNFGSSGGIYAYSLGTTSCNIGDENLDWYDSTNQHPVIAQNFYRLKNGRFEQIGMSWLKHGFFALSQTLCFPDCQGTDGTQLGIHCSDPYDSGLNGSQGNGPRSEVNAATGYFPFPIAGSYPSPAPTIGRRIQCAAADVDPALNAGALYWGEGQYIAADDAAAGNDDNNASHRRIQFAAGTFNASFVTGQSTVQQQPAIMAWQNADPSVVITNVDLLYDGRLIIAKKVTSLGGGNYHYEFAIQNLNSDRSARGFTVGFPAGTVISSAGFKDINYHSGEPYSGTDWAITINGASINWATETYAQNVNANALRWGTLYNFWFNATAATESAATIEPFKPEPCPPNPAVPPASGYTLNAAAPYDNPTLTAPVAGPTGDDVTSTVAIGFTFNFYGANYTTVNLCTNGFLSFTSTSNAYTNQCIPSSGAPNAMVAPFWDDLVVGSGECQYQTLGTAPNRRFVASWTNVNLWGTSQNQTFKAILDETTNKITTTIVATSGGGSSATRGIEDQNGTSGVQASCNQAGGAVAGTSQTYTPYVAILPSADLTITGSTLPFGVLVFSVHSNAPAGSPVELVASFDPGPTDFGPYGILNVGFTAGLWVPIIDGGGAFGPPNPAHLTNACGDLDVPIMLTGDGVPPGLVINVQGGVVAPFSVPPPPNGLFHITDMVQIIT